MLQHNAIVSGRIAEQGPSSLVLQVEMLLGLLHGLLHQGPWHAVLSLCQIWHQDSGLLIPAPFVIHGRMP